MKAASSIEFPDLSTIKQRLPAHLFKADLSQSLYYVAREVVIVGGLMFALSIFRSFGSPLLNFVAGVTYVLAQGTVFWGVFVLGHDCGHGSFSSSPVINSFFGNILHSFILTPYESWKLSHKHHHKNTGNIDNDEIFFPNRIGSDEDNAKGRRVRGLTKSLGPAWFMYLYLGYWPRPVPHFDINQPIYVKRRMHMIISLSCWCLAAFTSLVLCFVVGLWTMILYYYLPILVFASWLVVVTFLHHNDEETPWYSGENWNYVKGNLSSVDRTYGALIDNISHNIGTHQIHHLFPIIPHYKLVDAAAAFAKEFPQFVRVKRESIITAFLHTVKSFAAYGEVPKNADFFRMVDHPDFKSKQQ